MVVGVQDVQHWRHRLTANVVRLLRSEHVPTENRHYTPIGFEKRDIDPELYASIRVGRQEDGPSAATAEVIREDEGRHASLRANLHLMCCCCGGGSLGALAGCLRRASSTRPARPSWRQRGCWREVSQHHTHQASSSSVAGRLAHGPEQPHASISTQDSVVPH